ncbi:MAG: response regulator [Syntrophomonadaceae bacterium]|nr:response regulator [Syntrophomonadaceae bacterium]
MTKVLIINDSQFERLIMKDIVSSLGYEANTSDEYNIMNLIESDDPDIVIANMTMNRISGDKLIAAIKERKPEIKCYLSSCSKIPPGKLQYPDVDGYIETPVTPGRLERILKNEDQANSGAEQYLQQNIQSIQSVEASVLDDKQEKINKQHQKKQGYIEGDNSEKQPEKATFAFCPYCGHEMETKLKYTFCPFCGNKF